MTDKWYEHIPKAVYEQEDVTMFWKQAVHTDGEVTANRPDIIIKNQKEKPCILIKVAIHAKGNKKESKIQESVYRETTKVETEM
jgi:hypothetical protein